MLFAKRLENFHSFELTPRGVNGIIPLLSTRALRSVLNETQKAIYAMDSGGGGCRCARVCDLATPVVGADPGAIAAPANAGATTRCGRNCSRSEEVPAQAITVHRPGVNTFRYRNEAREDQS